MASPGKTSIAKSAVFAGWTITDLLSLTDGETGNPVEMTTDNAQTVNAHFVDSIKGSIVVTMSDLEQRTNAACFIGKTGSLAVGYGQRTQGKGFVNAHTLTVTYANAQIVDIRQEAGVTGTGQLVVTFAAYDPAGTAVASAAVA